MKEMAIIELQEKMKSGVYTARIITEMYLEHIEKLDKQGPVINAVTHYLTFFKDECVFTHP